MALRRLTSICPTAASTASPRPRDSTTGTASFPGPPIDPSASRSAVNRRTRDQRAPRRASHRRALAASTSTSSAAITPPVVDSASRITPDSSAEAPTSATTSRPITAR